MFTECKASTSPKLGAAQQTREHSFKMQKTKDGNIQQRKNTDPKSGMRADKGAILICKLVLKWNATRDLFSFSNVQTSQALLKGKSQPVLQSI